MISEINSVTFHGIKAVDVFVETQIANGRVSFTMVGLADKTIAEAKERVRASLTSIGLALPAKRILVNLAPADLIKEGSHFDLAIACSLLACMDIIPKESLKNYIVLGELSLDGRIKPVSGILPAAMQATNKGYGIICPQENAQEALWSGNKDIIATHDLLSLINHFKGNLVIPSPTTANDHYQYSKTDIDLSDIKGAEHAIRALEIAAAGGHNIIFSGPPGAGKSMLAARLPTILPALTPNEILESSMIYSIAGLLQDGILQSTRPFRAPHHSCSMAAMVGGGIGKRISPGEISLAHNGVLFLDEFPEFPKSVVDSLRQPLENQNITIARSGNNITFPANFQLVAAMNPCKCGYIADSGRACHKAPKCAIDYQTKISGPIMDRIDIHIDLPASAPYLDSKTGPKSSLILEKVNQARDIQNQRYSNLNINANAQISNNLLEQQITLDDISKKLLNEAAKKFSFSMRGYTKCIKIARTIADLDQAMNIKEIHIAEAIGYREKAHYYV